jgi:hypothetical protein
MLVQQTGMHILVVEAVYSVGTRLEKEIYIPVALALP